MTMVALQRSGSIEGKAYVKRRVVACICNVHVQYDILVLASIDLLRVNARGLAYSGSWHCAAEGGPSHERHQQNSWRLPYPPKITEPRIQGAEKKGYQSC